MSETQNIHGSEIDSPKKKSSTLSRRSFLKLTGATGAGAALGPLAWELLKLQETETRRDITFALEFFLGLTPKDATMEFMFPNHVITPSIAQRVEETRATTLMGEFTPDQIASALTSKGENAETRLWMRLLFPGFGVNKKELAFHQHMMRQYTIEGTPKLVGLDPLLDAVIGEKQGAEERLALFQPHLLVLAASIQPILPFLVKEIGRMIKAEKPDWRKFLDTVKRTTASTSMSLILGYILAGIAKNSIITEVPPELTPAIGAYAKAQSLLADLYLHPNPDNPWLNVWQALVGFRKNIMALHTWCALAKRCAPARQERMIAYAGTGHEQTRDLFIKGPQVCEMGVEQFAEQLLDSGLKLMLLKAQTLFPPDDVSIRDHILKQQDDWVADRLLDYSDMFPEPDFFGRDDSGVENSRSRYFPKTAKTILFDTLGAAIKNYLGKTGEENQRYARILQRVRSSLQSEIVDLAINDQSKKGNRVISYEDAPQVADEVNPNYMAAAQGLIKRIDGQLAGTGRARSLEQSLPFILSRQGWFTGLARFRGSIAPIFRTKLVSDELKNQETIALRDWAIINGAAVNIKKYTYRRWHLQQTSAESTKALEQELNKRNFSLYFLPMHRGGDNGQLFRASNLSSYGELIYLEDFPTWILDETQSDEDPYGVKIIYSDPRV